MFLKDSMNIRIVKVTHWDTKGEVRKLSNVYIRGSKIRFVIVPDMLKHAPMFKRLDPAYRKYGTGLGMGRGMKEMTQDKSGPGSGSGSFRGRGRGSGGDRGRGNFGHRGGGGSSRGGGFNHNHNHNQFHKI